ncbi:MAG TPA: hypothetical protein VFD85_11010 [Gemmatimonadales bacterium]|nr:hypothetical protein [Gemmatimonadales bacterium]
MSAVATINRAEIVQKAREAPVGRFRMIGAILTVAGAAILLGGLLTGSAARVWHAYHFNFLFWTALAQALVIFAATQKLAKAHWAGVIIRFAEAAVAFLVVSLVLYLGLILGRAYLFKTLPLDRPQVGFWFAEPFFLIRNWLILAVMAWLSWRFVRRDTAPDVQELATGTPATDDVASKGLASKDAAILIVSWAFAYSFLGFDFIMSLAPRWVSNLYGAFFFMGSFLSALMTTAVLAHWMRKAMKLEHLISPKQMHDLGKLSFGFTVFWAYLMWAQFLVIWYGNLPEETYFIFYRLWGPWRTVGTAVFFMVFVIPFIGLLGVKPKKTPATFILFALISVAGVWLERYLEVVPSLTAGQAPSLGLPELGALAFFAGLFLLAYGWFAGKYPMISPRLAVDTLEREQH